MAKVTKVLDDGSTTGLRVEEYRQEDDPSWLALRLAEYMTGAANRQGDYDALSAAADVEHTKARQLQAVIFQLRELERESVPPPVSRMDPLNFYELDKCEEEYEMLKQRAADLQDQADAMASAAQEFRDKAERTRRKIVRLAASS